MPQDVDYVARVASSEKTGERNGIFNRLISASPEVWKHRVSGISEERDGGCVTPAWVAGFAESAAYN